MRQRRRLRQPHHRRKTDPLHRGPMSSAAIRATIRAPRLDAKSVPPCLVPHHHALHHPGRHHAVMRPPAPLNLG